MIEDRQAGTILRLASTDIPGDPDLHVLMGLPWPTLFIETDRIITPEDQRWRLHFDRRRALGSLVPINPPVWCPLYYCSVNNNMLTHVGISAQAKWTVCEGEHPMYQPWYETIAVSRQRWLLDHGLSLNDIRKVSNTAPHEAELHHG